MTPLPRLLLPLLPLLPLLTGCARGTWERCGSGTSGCHEVAGGRYLASEPSGGWDGGALLVYFHPYNSSAEEMRQRAWIVEGLDDAGVVGIFPDGIDNSWAHQGSPSDDRDEVAFLDAVLADVEARWPAERRYASGFSVGGSMAWDAACYRGSRFDAVFPVSGAFWDPLPEGCTDGPVALRHTHGTSDTTVPMEGRPIGSSHQGDVLEGMAVWRQTNGCPEAPTREEVSGESLCQVWEGCSGGRPLWLCLHDGGHAVPDGWLGRNLAWAASPE